MDRTTDIQYYIHGSMTLAQEVHSTEVEDENENERLSTSVYIIWKIYTIDPVQYRYKYLRIRKSKLEG